MGFPALDVNEQAWAGELLDMLLASEQEEQQQHTDIVQEAMVGLDLHDDGGFQGDESIIVQEPVVASGIPAAQALPDTQQTYKVSNITQLRTADGKNIIILVQPSVQRPAAVINDSLTAPAVINSGLTAAVVDNSGLTAAVVDNSCRAAVEED